MALTEIDHLTDEMVECTDNHFKAAQVCKWCIGVCAERAET